jgi:nitroreductase
MSKDDDVMSLREVIYKRKSTRKYLTDTLDEKILQDIQNYFTKIKPLYCDIKVDFTIVGKERVKSLLWLVSPHYILAMSENKRGYLVNVGFMLQQVDLYLSSIGLGGCWFGMAQPKEKISGDMEFVIAFAFGKPAGNPYREFEDFKRKSLAELSDTVDSRLEVVRLAPSARNQQNYYFITEGNVVHVCCAKAGLLTLKPLIKMREIDVGIALAHLYVENSERFKFFEVENPKEVKGYYYMGSAEF